MNVRKGVSVKTKVMIKDIMVVQKIVLFKYRIVTPSIKDMVG